ncbi:hypothetical protein GXW83_01835 [Streptacidiphilus sp. PB12-B1b]|uniref:hypothetical protein n=1 Tax=Streptacidiphilus sp. PB12-B1b TaxID=2705012 RepID=UPI0015F973B2|nr:hypothetical protein [Streptacidiphilus sp. PB12-B1b]QMU74708.1 hypothetical protein GXW83_01835 [Streptacidiphilus sp. PB12-B1b]
MTAREPLALTFTALADHAVLPLLPLSVLLIAALLLSTTLRRHLGRGTAFAAVCFLLPLAATYAAIVCGGHVR